MAALLQCLPPQVHLVVASRTLPPWPLPRLRAAGRLVELGADRLRFSCAETRAFLQGATHGLVDELTSATVHQRMGGWTAAVRLAAVALRQAPDTAGVLDALAHRAEPHAIQYLLDEIVRQQPPHIADFLMRTAICRRMSPALADALLQDSDCHLDSAAVLQQVEEAGLLVTLEDGTRNWYRYHDLLRAALERRLRQECTAAQIQALHRRASAWLGREGPVEDAVHHALLAGERDQAAEIVENSVPTALNEQQWAQVAAWLALLPADLLDERPALLLADGWVAHRRLQYERLMPVLDRLTAWLDHHTQPGVSSRVHAVEAELDALRAAFHIHFGDAQRAFAYARSAWERLPLAAAHARGQAGCMWGMAAQMLGQREVVETLLRSDKAAELDAYPAAMLHVRIAAMNLQFAGGDYKAAEQTATYIQRSASERDLGFLAAWAHYFLGRIHYEWDNLAAAADHFAAVVELRHSAPVYALRGSLQGLALTKLAMGQPIASSEPMAQLLTLRDGPCFVEDEVGRAFQAHLALVQGNREAALDWLHTTPGPASRPLAIALEVPAITRVKLLLVEGTPSAMETAAREVDELATVYTARHDTPHTIVLLTLQALIAEAQGHREQALAVLEQAVRLGMPGGFVRTFVDRGAALARLLAALPARDDIRQYVDCLRAACATPHEHPVPPVPHREAMLPDLTEPLTTRETEVLTLLARRFSNKEIADTLSISWQTVAKHANNIYQKLRVAGRREAIIRAAVLGIVGPSDRTSQAGD